MLSFYWLYFKKLINAAKKILLVIIVFSTVISLFVYFIAKDRPQLVKDPIEKSREEIYKVINDPKLNKTEDGRFTIAFYRSLFCGLIGEACSDNPQDGDQNYNHSLFGFFTNLITLPYANPPASGVYWAYSGLQNTGFIPRVYAAEGVGLAALTPIKEIWRLFRNLLYMVLVLILIAIGFMIMFRMKINPQTVVSIENSLPKIIIALLLITFSLPIAGFLIDLTYIIMGIILLFFQSHPAIGETTKSLYSDIFLKPSSTVWEWFNPISNFDISFNTGLNLYSILPKQLQYLIQGIANVLGLKLVFLLVSFFTGGAFSFTKLPVLSKFFNLLKKIKPAGEIKTLLDRVRAAGQPVVSLIAAVIVIFLEIILFNLIFSSTPILKILIGAIFGILLGFSLLFIFFRIFFMLLYSYIQILVLVIFSPIILAFEAIPGKSSFAFWFKNLVYHLITWPLLVVLLLVNKALLTLESSSTSLWTPPFLDALNPTAFITIISIAILFLIPDLIKMFKEMLGIKPLPVEIGIGSFFAGGAAAGGTAMGLLAQYGSLALAFSHGPLSTLPGVQKLFGGPGQVTAGVLTSRPGQRQPPEPTQAGGQGGH